MRILLIAAAVAIAATGCASPTPTKKTLDGPGVIASLQSSGLPVRDLVALTAENDPNHLLGRPNQYTAKIDFRDTRLEPSTLAPGIDTGGTIELFATADNRKTREDYMRALAKSPLFAEYDYVAPSGLALLRVSNKLTPDQAAQYEAWLNSL